MAQGLSCHQHLPWRQQRRRLCAHGSVPTSWVWCAEDLIFDVGRHVDDSVHLFEDWGLPCWIKGDDGHNLNGAAAKAAGKSLRKGDKPVRSGRWQMMINGESYKCIVAEAAKNALGEDRIMERIFVVKLLLDKNTPNRIAGAVGFNLRANEVHIFKANTIMVAAGGAVNVYRPRSTGEGMGRAWYPVWNAGSTYTMCAQVGAEMTMMENRFVPARFKDGYGRWARGSCSSRPRPPTPRARTTA